MNSQMRATNTDHHTAAGLPQQQVPFLKVLFCFKINKMVERGNLTLPWRLVCLSRYHKKQVWGGSSNARGEKKWVRLQVQEEKSRREGRLSREGTGRADGFSSFRVCQNSRILAAGFWNALWQILFCDKCQTFPIISQAFSLWSAGTLKKVIFLLKEDQDPERP